MASSRRTTAKPRQANALNLNAQRLQRAKMHAARRGAQSTTLPIIFGAEDKVIAELGPECPLEVFAPLIDMLDQLDLRSLVVQIMDALQGEDQQQAALDAIVGVLVTSPRLPIELIEAVKGIGRALLGEDGYAAFVAERPSKEDVGALVSGLQDWYGISLGELLGSSTSSQDAGETSKPTSPTTTPQKTSGESGGSPETEGSSASAA